MIDRLRELHPRRILTVLDTIDAEPPSYQLNRPAALRRVFGVLVCVSVCLLLVHYGKYSSNLVTLLKSVGGLDALHASGFAELAGYGWWTAVHLLGFALVPMAFIRWGLGLRVRELGWRWADTAGHWRGYLLLLAPILVFVYIASLGEDFVNHYPFYDRAGRSWLDLIAWEALYIGQFICLEFFFRGFMVQALRPAIGANAVWVMCVPYLMIHFPKLWPEAFGAILFGLFLGILALRSRSIWGGVLVHVGVALSMDLAALARRGEWPVQWLPW